MEPIDYLGALRRSWRLLLVLGLVGLIVAIALPVSSGHGKKHVTKILEPWSASAIVGAAPPAGNTLVGGGVTGSQIVFYATSTKVQAATAKLFFGKNAIKPSHLSTYLKASLIVPKGVGKRQAQDANTVNLTAFNTSAKRAKRFANDYAHQVGVELNRIAASHVRVHSTAVSKASSGYQIVHPALTAVKHTVKKSAAGPVKSRKVRGLIGLGIGVVLAAVIVLMREVLSKRLRTSARAEATFGYPVVVEIPTALRAIGRRGLSVDVVSNPGSPAAEAYRMLRMSVLFEALASREIPANDYTYLVDATAVHEDGDESDAGSGAAAAGEPNLLPTPVTRKVVMVVSPSTEPTRPQVAANLAAAYAEAGQRVVVIGTGELGAGPPRGGGRNLTGQITPEDVEARLEPSWVDRVFRLDLRHFIENSGQLVLRMPAVLGATRAQADVVIVEAPPLLAIHHVEALSNMVDVVLVVGECGTTTFDEARRSGDLLRRMSAPVLGVVLTNVRLQYRDPRQLPDDQLELTSGGLGPDPDGATSSDAPAHAPA